MTSPKSTSLASIIQDTFSPRFFAELRTSWAIEVLYRPPSIPFIWVFARIGLSPTMVSLMALVLAVSMPLQAVFLPLGTAAICVMLSAMLFQVLDCVDGTLARLTGQTSQFGSDLDFLIDMAQWGLLYLSLGLLADRTLDSGSGYALIGAMAAWVRLFARVSRDRIAQPAKDKTPAHPVTLVRLPMIFFVGLSGLFPFFALAGPWLGLAVLFLLIYALLDMFESALPLLARPRA